MEHIGLHPDFDLVGTKLDLYNSSEVLMITKY